jgi:hypothetical protein
MSYIIDRYNLIDTLLNLSDKSNISDKFNNLIENIEHLCPHDFYYQKIINLINDNPELINMHTTNDNPELIKMHTYDKLSTLLMVAIKNDKKTSWNHKITKFLINNKNILINEKDIHDKTALHYAVLSLNLPIIKLLLDKEYKNQIININAEDKNGNTPLAYLSGYFSHPAFYSDNHRIILKLLLNFDRRSKFMGQLCQRHNCSLLNQPNININHINKISGYFILDSYFLNPSTPYIQLLLEHPDIVLSRIVYSSIINNPKKNDKILSSFISLLSLTNLI